MSIFFKWDSKKADRNVRRHGVSFSEAQTVFGDPFAQIIVNQSTTASLSSYALRKWRIGFVWFLRASDSRTLTDCSRDYERFAWQHPDRLKRLATLSDLK